MRFVLLAPVLAWHHSTTNILTDDGPGARRLGVAVDSAGLARPAGYREEGNDSRPLEALLGPIRTDGVERHFTEHRLEKHLSSAMYDAVAAHVEAAVSMIEVDAVTSASPLRGFLAPETLALMDQWASCLSFGVVLLVVLASLAWRLAHFVAHGVDGCLQPHKPDTPPLPAEATAFERFQAVATRTPHQPAVVVDGQATSYAQLLELCTRQAQQLGVAPGARVVLLLERSLDLLVLHLALWKLNACVVSLSPQESARRVAMMQEDCDAALILCRPGSLHDALKKQSLGDKLGAVAYGGQITGCSARRLSPLRPQHAPDTSESSIFFTSGSSGRPKGIVRTHEHELRFLHGVSGKWMQALAPGGKAAGKCRVLWAGAPGWLTVAWQAWAPLMVGGTVVILPPQAEASMEQTAQALLDVEVAILIPSLLSKLLPFFRDFAPTSFALKYVFCVGEACPSAMVKECYRFLPSVSVINSYGLTETLECQYVVPRGLASWRLPELCPIGAPAGCKIALLDHGQEAEEGELYFGGSLPDYLPTVDASDRARFIVRGGERWFRTGDLGRWHVVGGERLLCVTGRADRQVKLRGMRVELDEVEAALSGAGRVAVLRHGQQLAAFCDRKAAAVRSEALRNLPAHMRPATVLEGALPELANGKVDYVALQARLSAPEGLQSLVHTEPQEAAPDVLATPEGQQALEEGMDSLAMVSSMTPNHKREVTMTFMCMGLCLLGTITSHWRANGVGEAFTRQEDFFKLRPNGWGLYFFDALMLEHGFHTFILLSGYMHARESGCGWARTLFIYGVNVAMAWPFQPLSNYLGADYEPRHHGTFNWQRWFLLMVAVARLYTSALQTLRCPPAVQVGAALCGVLCFELATHDLWRSLHLEPDGAFFQQHGYPWLAKPPYIGYALMWGFFPGCVLRFNMLHCFSYHYMRRLQLAVQTAGRHLHLSRTWAPLLFAAALFVEFTVGPLNNHYPCGLEARGIGTPRKVSWYLLELVIVTSVSVSMMATFYVFQWRPWEIVGQCTLPSYLFHGCLLYRTRAFIPTLPRLSSDVYGGVLADASEIGGVLAVMVGQTLLWGLLFYAVLGACRAAARLLGPLSRAGHNALADAHTQYLRWASSRGGDLHDPVTIEECGFLSKQSFTHGKLAKEADTDGVSTQDTLSVRSAGQFY